MQKQEKMSKSKSCNMVFFFDCEKEPKSVEGCDSLHTTRNAPWRSGARGQQKTKTQKDFVNFGTKSFSFMFLFFVLHETKGLSRVNVFECGCTQTLDKPFCFVQFGSQEKLRQRMP